MGDSSISERLKQAIAYLKENDYFKDEKELCDILGCKRSALTMALNQKYNRNLSIQNQLTFCEKFPINFWWLRSGEGDMIGNGDRQIALLQKIAQLEAKIAELEKK